MTTITIAKMHCMSPQTAQAIKTALKVQAQEVAPSSFASIGLGLVSPETPTTQIEYWHKNAGGKLFTLDLDSFADPQAGTVAKATVNLLQDFQWSTLWSALLDNGSDLEGHEILCHILPKGVLCIPKIAMGIQPNNWRLPEIDTNKVAHANFRAFCTPGLSNHEALKLQVQMQDVLDRVWRHTQTYVKINTGKPLRQKTPVLVMSKDTP